MELLCDEPSGTSRYARTDHRCYSPGQLAGSVRYTVHVPISLLQWVVHAYTQAEKAAAWHADELLNCSMSAAWHGWDLNACEKECVDHSCRNFRCDSCRARTCIHMDITGASVYLLILRADNSSSVFICNQLCRTALPW